MSEDWKIVLSRSTLIKVFKKMTPFMKQYFVHQQYFSSSMAYIYWYVLLLLLLLWLLLSFDWASLIWRFQIWGGWYFDYCLRRLRRWPNIESGCSLVWFRRTPVERERDEEVWVLTATFCCLLWFTIGLWFLI